MQLSDEKELNFSPGMLMQAKGSIRDCGDKTEESFLVLILHI